MQLKFDINQLHYPDHLQFVVASVLGRATARLVNTMGDLVDEMDDQEFARLLAGARQ